MENTLKQKGIKEGQSLGNVLKILEKEWIKIILKFQMKELKEIIKLNSN